MGGEQHPQNISPIRPSTHPPHQVLYPSLADLPADSEEATQLRVQAATAVALVSGLLLAALGFLRLGAISHAFPPGLMVGFTAAAALAIGVSQVKELLGLKVPRFEYTWQTGWYVLSHLEEGQPASAVRYVCFVCTFGGRGGRAAAHDIHTPAPTPQKLTTNKPHRRSASAASSSSSGLSTPRRGGWTAPPTFNCSGPANSYTR